MEEWERKVFEFTQTAHAQQMDDSGENYFEAHILQVVAIIKQVTNDKDIISGAYMHDLIEDTQVTFADIQKNFGIRVADLVLELTKKGKNDNYGYYFPNLKSKEGILIRFADRLSNLSRMTAWNEKRQEQYIKRSKFWKDGSDLGAKE